MLNNVCAAVVFGCHRHVCSAQLCATDMAMTAEYGRCGRSRVKTNYVRNGDRDIS